MASPAQSQASEITQLAIEVFEDANYAAAWLNERNVALDNRSPAEVVMSDPKGTEVVKNLLLRIQYGVLA
ncbi:MAG TPA: MbcA/ParS/Xre antitoxin family protein [Bryobacteraceae bacterium]|nr:MbcA/ParS/Xre antitoxin family protein [Bryobacteraceae bacterium]